VLSTTCPATVRARTWYYRPCARSVAQGRLESSIAHRTTPIAMRFAQVFAEAIGIRKNAQSAPQLVSKPQHAHWEGGERQASPYCRGTCPQRHGSLVPGSSRAASLPPRRIELIDPRSLSPSREEDATASRAWSTGPASSAQRKRRGMALILLQDRSGRSAGSLRWRSLRLERCGRSDRPISKRCLLRVGRPSTTISMIPGVEPAVADGILVRHFASRQEDVAPSSKSRRLTTRSTASTLHERVACMQECAHFAICSVALRVLGHHCSRAVVGTLRLRCGSFHSPLLAFGLNGH